MKPQAWLLWLAAGIAIAGCGQSAAPEAEAEEETAPSKEITLEADKAKLVGIETVEVRMMPLQEELKVAGTVTSNAKGRAIVTPPVSGKVLRILANAGDQVTQGQALAILQSPDLAQAASAVSLAQQERQASEGEARKAESELSLAKGRLRTAQTQLSRQIELAKAGAFSQPSLQAAQNEQNESGSELESAKQDESVHQTQLVRAERLFKQELISKSDLEIAKLAVIQDQVRGRRAQSRLLTATAALKREEEIARKGLLTAKEVQTAEAEARAAKLEVQRAQILLESAKSALVGAQRAIANAQSNYAAVRGAGNGGSGSTITLTAPISGTVTQRLATVGQAVERSSELFEIENLNTVWVTANVPEKQIASVTRGLRVRITAAAYPGKEFAGVVELLGNHLDSKTRTMPVQCLVQNASGLLREDMFATVMLGIGASTEVIVVPDSSIDHHTEEVSVFVANGDKYERRTVKTGRSAKGFTEVVSGLKVGERVVTKGMFIVESESRKNELKGEE